MAGTGAAPDPLRDLFIPGARRLLERAYARPGVAVSTVLADPGEGARQLAARLGINPFGPDNVSARGGRSGGLNARSRWARAFVRCLYDQHRWWAASHGPTGGWRRDKRMVPLDSRALEIEVGAHRPAVGVIPAGRPVTIRLRTGGAAKLRAVQRMPDKDRIYDDRGDTAARWSDPALRDW